MHTSAVKEQNKALAGQIRDRARKLADRELQTKASRLAEMVEQSETLAPASVVEPIFRKPTPGEEVFGLKLEELAGQLAEKQGKAVA